MHPNGQKSGRLHATSKRSMWTSAHPEPSPDPHSEHCSQSISHIFAWVLLDIIIALERELVGKLGSNYANKMKWISFSFRRVYFSKTSVRKLWKQPYLIKQMLRNLMFSVEKTWFLPSVFVQLQPPHSRCGKKESWLFSSLTNIFHENCHHFNDCQNEQNR